MDRIQIGLHVELGEPDLGSCLCMDLSNGVHAPIVLHACYTVVERTCFSVCAHGIYVSLRFGGHMFPRDDGRMLRR